MRNYWKGLFVAGSLSLSMPSHAQPVDIGTLHYAQATKQSRLIFDVSASPKHRVFVQNKATQLVIDINNANLTQAALPQPSANHPLFGKVHILSKNKDAVRIAVDLKQPVTAKNFALNTDNKNEHKLVVALINKDTPPPVIATVPAVKKETIASESNRQPVIKHEVLQHQPVPAVVPEQPSTMFAALTDRLSDKATNVQKISHPVAEQDKIVIAIDPGHGGEDPGAHGTHGTEEKQVVFAIAQKLATLINAQPDMKAVTVRKGDYFVGLRKRMQIARKANADLFVSIHADAFQDANVRGSSVYVLSEKGASSEAAVWLAKSENASDLVGGVSLEDKEDVLATVLLDLSQSATEQASYDIAKSVLKTCHSVGEMHKEDVQKANFMVLKSPDIPSILVETAFISNPSEEENLLNTEYQNKMANAIFSGVRDYFKNNPPLPQDTKVATL
jgi:N-acetylmuramoyl-L-alanine amidase